MYHSLELSTSQIIVMHDIVSKKIHKTNEDVDLEKLLREEMDKALLQDRKDDDTVRAIFLINDGYLIDGAELSLVRTSENKDEITYEVRNIVNEHVISGVFKRTDLQRYREDGANVRKGTYLPY